MFELFFAAFGNVYFHKRYSVVLSYSAWRISVVLISLKNR